MKYEEAIEIMKRGGTVHRGGKTHKIARGIQDVTDPENPVRIFLSDEDRAATDWEEGAAPVVAKPEVVAPEVVAPEVVDEALHETIPETLGELE